MKLIPGAIGSALGVYLILFPGMWKLESLGAAAVALLLLLIISRIMFPSAPRLWRWGLEAWIFFLPIATGLVVYVMLVLTTMLTPDQIIPFPNLSDDKKPDIIKYGVLVVGTLLTGLVSGDPAKAENLFWPSAQFKKCANKLAPNTAIGAQEYWHAAAGKCTYGNEVCGWGFKARSARVKVLDP